MKTTRKPKRTGPTPTPLPGSERLQKILAAAGLGSRRACEELIREGRVQVNGQTVTRLGTRADALQDRIHVDGERVGRPRRTRYYLVNKPRGVVTTTRDPHAKRTVLDLVPSQERLFPVGRLDASSEGLLLLTNDGPLAQVLLHPSYEVPRTYRVSVHGGLREGSLARLKRGMRLDGEMHRVEAARLLRGNDERSVVELTLIEGRRRQIRRMLEHLGHPVRRLLRVRFGPLRLSGLKSGEWRRLTPPEIHALEQLLETGKDFKRGQSSGNSSRKRVKNKS